MLADVDFVVVRDDTPFMLVECKMSAQEPMSTRLKSFAAKLKVPYAYQVAIGAPLLDIDKVQRNTGDGIHVILI